MWSSLNSRSKEPTFGIQTDAESSPDALNGRSVRIILTVDDPDSVFASAVAAGVVEVASVTEGYGWRIGRVADPSGHHWEIGRRLAT
jgi:PhnB protein